jgi:hypothetical protein
VGGEKMEAKLIIEVGEETVKVSHFPDKTEVKPESTSNRRQKVYKLSVNEMYQIELISNGQIKSLVVIKVDGHNRFSVILSRGGLIDFIKHI